MAGRTGVRMAGDRSEVVVTGGWLRGHGCGGSVFRRRGFSRSRCGCSARPGSGRFRRTRGGGANGRFETAVYGRPSGGSGVSANEVVDGKLQSGLSSRR